MKTLTTLALIFTSSLIATQSFANIYFTFKHNPSSSNAYIPSTIQTTLYLSAKKENGAHLAESESSRNLRNDLYPGESSQDFVHSSLFAPDPTGTYIIRINCYLRSDMGKLMQAFTKKISLPKDGSIVSIEAECPVTIENNTYYPTPPKNISIKVDDNYIMPAPSQK